MAQLGFTVRDGVIDPSAAETALMQLERKRVSIEQLTHEGNVRNIVLHNYHADYPPLATHYVFGLIDLERVKELQEVEWWSEVRHFIHSSRSSNGVKCNLTYPMFLQLAEELRQNPYVVKLHSRCWRTWLIHASRRIETA